MSFNLDKNFRLQLSLLLLCILLSTFTIPTQAQPFAEDHRVFLPLITVSDSSAGGNHQPNAQELELAKLIKEHPNQMRVVMNYDPILSKVARERALDMGTRDYFGHVNPDGHGPNYLVQQAGYILPSFYDQSKKANNIESIYAGSPDPERAMDVWLGSDGHHNHILGQHSFYAEQTDYGIGYAYVPGSRYGHYWVVITARH